MLLLVIIIGTVAFVLFLGSMKYITPVETSVFIELRTAYGNDYFRSMVRANAW